VICRGPECGDRKGSSALQALFHHALEANQARETTEVAWQSCFGRCTQGPNVLVRELVADSGPQIGSGFATMPGPRGATALYNHIDGSRVERVVLEHVVGGRVIREFIERPGLLHSQPVVPQTKNKDG
jgi:(2Fe-2S) ferredoxin